MSKDGVKIVVAAAVLLVAIGIIVSRGSGGPAPSRQQAYFYDVASGALFAAPALDMPPVDAPSGAGNGVSAVVMGCGDCSASAQKLVYLLSLTEQARPLAAERGIANPQVLAAGILVAAPPPAGQAPAWVRMDSPEGEAVTAAANSLCEGMPGMPCTPAHD